ncbi:unnamed protein product [Cyclocybe aegerita]|uniref:Uncharacterized protein n=1 Tax=Cyclocybe aegerita TaxID=1973307 RepID=A0A8S0XF54_CYCAE|nr:unnamed protein product [Cyclocybe aegerita]
MSVASSTVWRFICSITCTVWLSERGLPVLEEPKLVRSLTTFVPLGDLCSSVHLFDRTAFGIATSSSITVAQTATLADNKFVQPTLSSLVQLNTHPSGERPYVAAHTEWPRLEYLRGRPPLTSVAGCHPLLPAQHGYEFPYSPYSFLPSFSALPPPPPW